MSMLLHVMTSFWFVYLTRNLTCYQICTTLDWQLWHKRWTFRSRTQYEENGGKATFLQNNWSALLTTCSQFCTSSKIQLLETAFIQKQIQKRKKKNNFVAHTPTINPYFLISEIASYQGQVRHCPISTFAEMLENTIKTLVNAHMQ